MNKIKKFPKFLLILFLSQNIFFAAAETSSTEADLKEITSTLLSPYCPGRLLQDCPSGAATDLKNKIEARLKAGEKKEEIVQSLYKEYGEELRSTPGFQDFGAVAWLGPVFFLFLGLLILGVFLFRGKQVHQPGDSGDEE